MALPPLWKSEIQEAVKETTAADEEQRIAEEGNNSARIATSINALTQAQETQTDREDANDKKNRTINKLTLGLVALTVLFTGLSWCTFREQLYETRAEQRPWVYAVSVEPAGRIILDESEYAIPLKFSIKNTGHLPAFFVTQKTSATVLEMASSRDANDGTSTLSVKNAVCDAYKARPITLKDEGTTVFAGQTITHGGFTRDDYPRILKESWNALNGKGIILIFGCIDYQFQDQPGHHQSRFSFTAGTRSDQGILPRIGPIPLDPTTVDIRFLAAPIDGGVPAD